MDKYNSTLKPCDDCIAYVQERQKLLDEIEDLKWKLNLARSSAKILSDMVSEKSHA